MPIIHRCEDHLGNELEKLRSRRAAYIALTIVLALVFLIGEVLWFGCVEGVPEMQMPRYEQDPGAPFDWVNSLFPEDTGVLGILMKMILGVIAWAFCFTVYMIILLAELALNVVWFLIRLVFSRFWPMLLGLVPLMYAAGMAFEISEKIGQTEGGVQGERLALEMVAKLPDSCHVFTNKYICYRGQRSETDLILVGPGGVAIMETKYWNGAVEGCVEDENLFLVHKNGQREEKYNPAAQVSTHVYRLAGYLREQNENVWVTACVLFNHPQCKVDVKQLPGAKRSDVRILTVDAFDAFAEEISRGMLKKKQVERIVRLIEDAPETILEPRQASVGANS